MLHSKAGLHDVIYILTLMVKLFSNLTPKNMNFSFVIYVLSLNWLALYITIFIYYFSFLYSFVVNYSLNPTSKKYYFDHVNGSDGIVQFWLRGNFLLCCPDSSQEHQDILSSPNSRILRERMKDAPLERKDWKKIKKPSFLFVDPIEAFEDCLFDSNYKWLHQISGQYLFLSNME